MTPVVTRDDANQREGFDLVDVGGLLRGMDRRVGVPTSEALEPAASAAHPGFRGNRVWPRWANAGLLLLQAIALTIAGSLAPDVRLPEVLVRFPAPPVLVSEPPDLVVALPSILAILAAMGFLAGVRPTWLVAMAIQAWSLLTCFQAYFANRPGVVYPVMLYSICMVLYLNSVDVRLSLEAGLPTRPAEDLFDA